MKTCGASLVLVSAAIFGVACGGTKTSAPASGDGGSPTDPPGPAQTTCTDCIEKSISWGQTGGNALSSESSSLASCRTYQHIRTPRASTTPVVLCSTKIDACGASTVDVGEVEAALANADVVAALSDVITTYGTDSRPCDGSILEITVGARTFGVGGECGGTSVGCSSMPCVAVPAGVRALANVLEQLDAQEAARTPACAGK